MSFYDDYVADGLCCSSCGEMISGDEPGFARLCAGCSDTFKADDRHSPRVPAYRKPPPNKPGPMRADQVGCPDCGKRVKAVGLRHHRLDKHGNPA